MGTTVNDVMLAICSGALRKYLLEKDKLPLKSLIAMIPVSIRSASDKGNEGNQLTNILVKLATQIEDPIERLELIHESTVRGKTYQGAIGAKTLSNMAQAVPFGVANQAARLYTRYHLAKLHSPVFNVTITNVPGPQLPIYLYGHKVLTICGMAPIIDGMGLIITIFSYNGQITVSPTSDASTMPDINTFTKYILESANELEKLILNQKKKKSNKKSASPKLQTEQVATKLRKFMKDNPEAMWPDSGRFLIHINKPSEGYWTVDINKQPGTIRKSKSEAVDATFHLADEHLVKMVEGKLNVQAAFLQGRLKVDGDFDKAMNLARLFKKMNKSKS